MNTIQKEAMIRATRGRIFSVDFVKRDGTTRHMVARLGVKSHLHGGSLKFEPRDRGCMVAWDTVKRDYRMINLDTLKFFKCGRMHWRSK